MNHLSLLCFALVMLAAVVRAGSIKEDDLQERISQRVDEYFQARAAKRALGKRTPLCDGKPCCEVETCEHGTCTDEEDSENSVYEFGWQCLGDECGNREGQYSGIGCNHDAEHVCDACKAHADYHFCVSTTTTLEGNLCYDKNWDILDARALNIMHGYGTARDLSRLAKEEAEKKSVMRNLLERLLTNLE